MTESQQFFDKQWGQIVARAWADEDFKGLLIENPKAVLRAHGLEMAPDIEVKVLEDSGQVRHFVLPPSPVGDLTEEELSPVAGTDSFSGICGLSGGCGCGGCRGCRGCDEA